MRAIICLGIVSIATYGFASDMSIVPFWDGETSETYTNRFGGGVLHEGGTNLRVQRVTNNAYAGQGAYRIDTMTPIPVGGFGFFQTQLTPNGPTSAYQHGRDISRFEAAQFWIRNDSSSAFHLKYEIKDYRNLSNQSAIRRILVPANSGYTKVSIPLNLSDPGWTVQGTPDLSRARYISYVVEADQGSPVNGSFYVDEAQFVEPGGPLDIASAPITALTDRLARRSFDGLWGTRNRTNGLVPIGSTSGNVGAMNSTSAMLKMLPGAIERGWVSRSTADQYVSTLVGSLNTMLDTGTYLPSRYVDWNTLAPVAPFEESSVDAAFMALALHQYKRLPETNASLAAAIDAVQNRFNFAAFSDTSGATPGFRMAYFPNTNSFTAGTYHGYGGEEWLLALAAHLSDDHHVDIKTHYHAGVARTKTFLVNSQDAHLVHSSNLFRAPFTQYLMQLFVDVEDRGLDNYPVVALASNPGWNASSYQRDMDARLAQQGRELFLQPDAGSDGFGQYQAYSMYNQFGRPDLFMPWSVTSALLGDEPVATEALRHHLQAMLSGPLGLSDSAWWANGGSDPYQLRAGHDFWNSGLSAMALFEHVYQDSQFLSNLPEVVEALDKVFYWTWDGVADGSWSSLQWNGGMLPPTALHDARIVNNTVTVSSFSIARRTRVSSGGLHVLNTLRSDVVVDMGGTISGSGTVLGDLDIQGAFAIADVSQPLTVTDGLTLGTESRLEIANEFAMTPGTSTTFDILTASGITGEFDAQAGTGPEAHLRDGYFLSHISYQADRVEVEVLAALPGDANGDRVVDGSDFNIWNQSKFLAGTDWTTGDFNGDGLTDGSDFGIWNQNKFTAYDQARTNTVPEPGLGLGILVFAAAMRRVCLVAGQGTIGTKGTARGQREALVSPV